MGDSDDEYDRRRVRDKFRGERSEYEQRRPRGGDYRERRDWGDRSRPRDSWSGGGRDQNWDRKRGGQYYGRARRDSEGGEGQISPPMKRNRRDWDASYDKMGSGSMMQSPGVWTSGRGPMMQQHQDRDQGRQGQGDGAGDHKSSQSPRMMSFKSFLLAQEDNIDEVEAVRRYQEYKTEFRKTQLSDFFVLHKDEEWFKNKYHPIDAKIQAKEKRSCLKRRLKIFLDLFESGYMENVSLDGNNADAIIKLLDAVAIKLEGGSPDDLNVLEDEKDRNDGDEQTADDASQNSRKEEKEIKPEEKEEETAIKEEELQLSPSSVPLPDKPPKKTESSNGTDQVEKKKKKRTKSEDEEGSENESSESESEAEPPPPGEENLSNAEENQSIANSGNNEIGDTGKQDTTSDTANKEYSSQGEEDGGPEPRPPGADNKSSAEEDSAKSKDGGDSSNDKDKEDVSGTSGDEEKKGKLGAYLAMMKNESTDEHADESKTDFETKEDEEAGKVDKKPKEEKKARKRDWEGRKGTGLGAFVARMGGEANEDSDSDSESDSDEDDDDDDDEDEEEEEKESRSTENDARASESKERNDVNGDKRYDHDDANESREHDAEGRQLHKTLSLFMRSVPPNISKADISAVCKRYPGYLRVALADPNPERGFYRRGWVTFENVVNIKDICWNLSNIRIKDCELNPVVNRDLSKRIRPISGLTLSKQAVRFDIKLSAKLVQILDERFALYSKEIDDEEKNENDMDVEEDNQATANESEDGDKEIKEGDQNVKDTADVVDHKTGDSPEASQLPDKNPVLEALPQLATESVEGEEVELVGDKEAEAKEDEVDFTRDENLMKALDRLLLYLRIVHSLDYYNCSDYANEDEMPNRCGVLHVRGTEPEKATQSEVLEMQKSVEQKLEHFTQNQEEKLPDADVQKLGKKNVEEEVENFIKANTQELAKDKWLCPLSGKKFRAKEFVRKHIFNKHSDKLEAVKTEVEFFNNYLSDSKRPQFTEFKPSSSSSSSSHGHQQPMNYQMGWNPRGHMMYGGPRGPFTPQNYGSGHDMYARGGMTYPPKPARTGSMARDTRKVVEYKDLDAPDDMDFF